MSAFVVQPTREELAAELNTALGTSNMGEKIVEVLEEHSDRWKLYLEFRTDNNSGLCTRDDRVRQQIRELVNPDDFTMLNEGEARTVERILLKYHELWPAYAWTVGMALQRLETTA